MSSAEVRAALFDYFSTAQLTGIRRVYKAAPWWADGAEWNFAVDQGSATIAFLHLESDEETRVTVPASMPALIGGGEQASGQKCITYKVILYLLMQYLIPSADTEGVSEDDWIAPLDATIDAVKDLIRSDPNVGAPDVIFQAGQAPGDLKTMRDNPFLMQGGGSLGSWSSVTFTVDEIIEA